MHKTEKTSVCNSCYQCWAVNCLGQNLCQMRIFNEAIVMPGSVTVRAVCHLIQESWSTQHPNNIADFRNRGRSRLDYIMICTVWWSVIIPVSYLNPVLTARRSLSPSSLLLTQSAAWTEVLCRKGRGDGELRGSAILVRKTVFHRENTLQLSEWAVHSAHALIASNILIQLIQKISYRR